jgi:hypothetical protein
MGDIAITLSMPSLSLSFDMICPAQLADMPFGEIVPLKTKKLSPISRLSCSHCGQGNFYFMKRKFKQ